MATLGATASTATFPATAADVGAEASGAVATHAAAADPHTGYRLESADHSHASTGLQGGLVSGQPGGTDVAVADGGTGASTAADARTALGLVIGTDVVAPARFGRTKHASTVDYQLPGRIVTATSTVTVTINTDYYFFCWTPTTIVLDQLAFNVTVGPLSDANVRTCIYLCDGDNQPSGAPLGDAGTAVATAFTGVKTVATAVTIPPGPFVIACNVSVAMTLRTWRGWVVGGFIDSALGSGSGYGTAFIARAYAAFPTPGSAWTGVVGSDAHVVLRVTTP